METKTIFILILLFITTLSWPNFDWFTMFSLFFNSGPPAVCVVVKENIDLLLLSGSPGFFHTKTRLLSQSNQGPFFDTGFKKDLPWFCDHLNTNTRSIDKDSSYSSFFACPAISFWSLKPDQVQARQGWRLRMTSRSYLDLNGAFTSIFFSFLNI